jgi:hypothetical protein
MPVGSFPNGLPPDSPFYSTERRKSLRFGMRFPVLLRAIGNSWGSGETVEVGTSGAFLVADRPLLLGVAVEFVLTFPPDLTKAPHPLRLRFCGKVVRCERVSENSEAFEIAVQNDSHHYLSREQSASYDAIEQHLLVTSRSSEG